jgi:hypothetical protein
MAVMHYIEQLVRSIDGRIEAIHREIASLEEAREALNSNGSGSGHSVKPDPGPSTRRRAPSRRRRGAPPLPEAVEQILTNGDGLSAPAVAEQAGASRDQVLGLLRELETARRARRSGRGRGTRWHLMTEEDWIRERAADLAARATRAGG